MTTLRKGLFCILTAMATGLVSGNTLAYDGGELIVRAGLTRVQPNDDSDPLKLNGTEFSQLGAGLPKTEVQVDGDTTIGITLTYMLNDHWGIGLLGAVPFEHDIHASALGVQVGETKQLPPTLTLQYFPFDKTSALQPYVGIGVNYTRFYDEEVNSELDAALAGLGATGDASLSLDNSWGVAFQLGADYKFSERWVVNGSLWYINIETSAEIDAPGLGKIETDVEIDPWGYMLSLGYIF